MTLSVLMSVYHKESGNNLDQALESIWTKQTLKPDQIVLVQDGPLTDELYDVIDKYKKLCGYRLCSPVLEHNSGLVAALNKGLECITSELVARMDSDDLSSSDRFEKQVKFMCDNPSIDVSSGSLQEFSEDNTCISVRTYPKKNLNIYISKASPLAHAASIMRMKIFREGGLRYDSKYPLNEDIALWFDVLRKGYTMSNIDDIIYYVRSDGGMMQRRSKAKANTEFLAYFHGIKDLFGVFSWRYIYPITRWIFRMMPVSIITAIYGSSFRQKFLSKSDS